MTLQASRPSLDNGGPKPNKAARQKRLDVGPEVSKAEPVPITSTPPAPMPMDVAANGMQLSVIAGVVERITYQNEDNGYTVAKLLPNKAREGELVTIVGTLPSLVPGESLELGGIWKSHREYGKQFEVERYRVVLPATIVGLRKYLGSGLIKGVGPVYSKRIVDRFGLDTLEILETNPEKLIEVPGLGRKRADTIKKAWAEQRAIKEVMLFLQGQGISTSLAVRIYKEYGDSSISVVKNEPYRLARDVFGIGFKTADKIAAAMGIARDDPERLKAGVRFALSEATEEGHVYLPREELIKKSVELLEAEEIQVENAVEALAQAKEVESERLAVAQDWAAPAHLSHTRQATSSYEAEWQRAVHESKTPYSFEDESETDLWDMPPEEVEKVDAIYLPPFHHAEQGISAGILRLKNAGTNKDRLAAFKSASFDLVFEYLANKENLILNEQQKQAVQLALTDKVSVLTGGPGTGKTTSMRALLRVLAVKKKKVILAAPTGRAAKRLSETTGAPATTIHRLLALRPGGKAAFDRDNQLDADMVIVDEASMLDVLLMNRLVQAIPNGAHLLLVGDTDQLPSVGAGSVLNDVVSSEVVPVVRLQHIFRQSAGSAIVTNAHRINQGQMPLAGKDVTDFFFFTEMDTEKCAELLVELVAERIPRKFGVDPIKDIQVLAPMHRTEAGVGSLNERLQNVLNPPGEHKAERKFGGKTFRVGDKVMQLKNNYDKEVFNGDTGFITAVDFVDQVITLRLEDSRVVDYEFSELDELALAYAVSVHKSQGSEYPVVVMPLVGGHYMMLQRNLVYTAVTRARKIVVLVGSKQALARAVHNNKTSRRFSGLAARLRDFSIPSF